MTNLEITRLLADNRKLKLLLATASDLFKEWIDDEDIRNAPKQSFSGRVHKLTTTIDATLNKRRRRP